ncbi:MAG: ParB N-terminal domain-containing protein [Acidimicrobiia bacterium]|nr:ParB N-terminal domain-containing protein [Acidimicrobiia bacterium]
MTWYPQDTYTRARWQESWKRIAAMVRGQQPQTLIELDEVQGRLGLFQQSYVGVRPIPVDQIIGSVDKSRDFDKDFRPRTDRTRQRWEQLERTFPDGDFPAIEVYKVDQTYYVIDGHHRVGISKVRKVEFIDAEITELHSPFELEPDVDIAAIIHLQQKQLFLQQSGLGLVRPDPRIECSRPVGYVQLLENLEVYGYHLQHGRGELLSREAVAADWYDTIYLKSVADIEEAGLTELLPHSPISDLYLWVHQRRQSLYPDRGSMSFRTAAEDLVEEESRRLTTRAKKKVERVEDSMGGVVDRLKRPSDAEDR